MDVLMLKLTRHHQIRRLLNRSKAELEPPCLDQLCFVSGSPLKKTASSITWLMIAVAVWDLFSMCRV